MLYEEQEQTGEVKGRTVAEEETVGGVVLHASLCCVLERLEKHCVLRAVCTEYSGSFGNGASG
jgi:hypothetical protein